VKGTLRDYLAADRAVQVLVVNQLAINIGFFMLMPFLPGYLTGDLGFAAWMVGLVVGVRNLSQQGLFLLGGTLSDRIGYRPVIIAGCAVRTLGFALMGIFTDLVGVLVAAFLTGLAGSLFAPAIRAYIAVAAGEKRVQAFALYNVFGQTGLLAGPLIGVALLGVDFRVVCFLAALIFAALSVQQLRYLPPRMGSEAHSTTSVLGSYKEALSNRAFVLFALAMLGYFTLFNQVYVALPIAVRQATHDDGGVAVVFTISGLLTILGQSVTTEYCKRRWRSETSVVIGMALMGLAFAPLFLAAPFLPLPALHLPSGWLGPAGETASSLLSAALAWSLNLTPVALSSALLTLGIMVCLPFFMDMIPKLSGDRMVGTYFGLFYLATGVGAAVGNLAVGVAFDAGPGLGLIGLPWLVLIIIGLASAAAVALFDRLGLLKAAPVPVAARQA
jgi:MFS family permease